MIVTEVAKAVRMHCLNLSFSFNIRFQQQQYFHRSFAKKSTFLLDSVCDHQSCVMEVSNLATGVADFMTAERRLPVVIFNVTPIEPTTHISFWSLSPFDYGSVPVEALHQLRTSALNQCFHSDVHRKFFGVDVEDLKLYSIPLTMSTLLSPISEWMPNYFKWTTDIKDNDWFQEFLLPMVLVLSMGAVAAALAIPFLLFSCLVWGFFNSIRILVQKRLRKLIRWTLIRMELGRRWKLERTFPRQHFRKWQEREKYRLPKLFQDSDKSNDDEPEELQRKPIEREVSTTWADHHIEALGFDPDNLSWDLVYGDLIGKPKKLHPVARGYVRWLKRQTAAEQENLKQEQLGGH